MLYGKEDEIQLLRDACLSNIEHIVEDRPTVV